jgi:phage shock protein PspC (stress-responsive transcriptional regulator)
MNRILDSSVSFARRHPWLAAGCILLTLALPPLAWMLYRTLELAAVLFRIPPTVVANVKAGIGKALDWKAANPWLFWAAFTALFMPLPGLIVLAVAYAAMDETKSAVWSGGTFEVKAPSYREGFGPGTGPPIGPLLPGQTVNDEYWTGNFLSTF